MKLSASDHWMSGILGIWSGLLCWLAGVLGCTLGLLVWLPQALLHLVHSGTWFRHLYWYALGMGYLQASWVEVSCVPWSVGHHLICLLPSLGDRDRGSSVMGEGVLATGTAVVTGKGILRWSLSVVLQVMVSVAHWCCLITGEVLWGGLCSLVFGWASLGAGLLFCFLTVWLFRRLFCSSVSSICRDFWYFFNWSYSYILKHVCCRSRFV